MQTNSIKLYFRVRLDSKFLGKHPSHPIDYHTYLTMTLNPCTYVNKCQNIQDTTTLTNLNFLAESVGVASCEEDTDKVSTLKPMKQIPDDAELTF